MKYASIFIGEVSMLLLYSLRKLTIMGSNMQLMLLVQPLALQLSLGTAFLNSKQIPWGRSIFDNYNKNVLLLCVLVKNIV